MKQDEQEDHIADIIGGLEEMAKEKENVLPEKRIEMLAGGKKAGGWLDIFAVLYGLAYVSQGWEV